MDDNVIAGKYRSIAWLILAALQLTRGALQQGEPYLVKLQRRPLRPSDDYSVARPALEAGAFVGRVFVGSPAQELLVTFDTSSGHVLLPSSRCFSASCLEHRRYAPEASTSAWDIALNSEPLDPSSQRVAQDFPRDVVAISISNMELGKGDFVGELVQERVCLSNELGQPRCAELGIVAATKISDAPFRAMPQDGVVGLGLRGLAVGPEFNFLNNLLPGIGNLKQFGYFIGQRGGELSLGGPNPARLASPLAWFPVAEPEQGYWQLMVKAVRVGNVTLDICSGGCRGIVDSSASRLGVPPAFASVLEGTYGRKAAPDVGCQGPEIHFQLEDGTLTLSPRDYMGKTCEPQLSVLTELPEELSDVLILGEPLLRRYYAVFDWDSSRVGFGLAAMPDEAEDFESFGIPEMQSEGQTHQAALWDALAFEVILVLLISFFGIHCRLTSAMFPRSSGLSSKPPLPETLCLAALGPPTEALHCAECIICLESDWDDRADCCGAQEGDASEESESTRPKWSRLPCGHHFHQHCVLQWIRKAERCPVCRAHILKPAAA
mmetsp:Transcript_42609/g.92842  ORF Transcript_42609/g.92842 Transcript_42609/m.92842 type:complete len:549 (+) Transcript_42609:153-1799(+)